MVVVQDDVPLEAESSVVGYNLNATMMASAHAGSVDIYARTPSDPLWTPTARTETLIRSHITAGTFHLLRKSLSVESEQAGRQRGAWACR